MRGAGILMLRELSREKFMKVVNRFEKNGVFRKKYFYA